MVNSSLTPRRVVTAAGLALVVVLSGCSTPAPSSSRASKETSSPHVATAGDGVALQAASAIYARRVAEFEADPAARFSHAQRIGYADALLHLGKPREAIQELINTEITFAEAYVNALYLGLAYEMAGDLKSAHRWVARSIERNVDARGGSQWLHLAMIEARLALARNPAWLENHSVIEAHTHRTAEEILTAIRIQLAVRGDFRMKPDAVVSDLYFEAGICASSLASRQEYFAQSLEISPLRLAEIERHERVRARAHASVTAH